MASAFPPGGRPAPPGVGAAAAVPKKAHYSFTEIQKLWVGAGGDPNKAVLAAAVAMAESHGDANAQHRNSDGSIDRGLWQINSVHGAQSTIDPHANARAAIAISANGRNWKPWTTFKSGAYKEFAKGDKAFPSPVEAVKQTTDAVPNPASGIEAIASFLTRLGVIFERDFWKRAGLVILGILALGAAVVGFGKQFAKGLPAIPIPV